MRRRAMVMVAALALAGGACGGDDDGDVTDGAAATSDSASATSVGASATSVGASATSEDADDADDSADVTATVVTVGGAGTDDGTNDGGTVVDVVVVRDELVRQLILAGMTEEQATCMADNLDMEEVAANGANDLMMFIELFETCGVDASKLTQPGP